jgi:hypothetical protein
MKSPQFDAPEPAVERYFQHCAIPQALKRIGPTGTPKGIHLIHSQDVWHLAGCLRSLNIHGRILRDHALPVKPREEQFERLDLTLPGKRIGNLPKHASEVFPDVVTR